jgi:aldehyde:ferredoxin oxidoreductase
MEVKLRNGGGGQFHVTFLYGCQNLKSSTGTIRKKWSRSSYEQIKCGEELLLFDAEISAETEMQVQNCLQCCLLCNLVSRISRRAGSEDLDKSEGVRVFGSEREKV